MRRNRELLPLRREQEGRLTSWSESSLLNPSTFFSGSPWQVMRRMQEDMDQLFSQLVQPVAQELQQVEQAWAPSVDVSETDREWLIEAELPGVSKDRIDIEVREGHLLLRAELRQEQEEQPGKEGQEGEQRRYYRRERRYGYFERVLPLPENVDEAQIRCEFRDGVLKVHLPKTEEQKPQGRKIPVGEGVGQSVQSAQAESETKRAGEKNAGKRS